MYTKVHKIDIMTIIVINIFLVISNHSNIKLAQYYKIVLVWFIISIYMPDFFISIKM